MSVISREDFKTHLNIPANVVKDDAEVQRTLDATERHVAALIGPLTTGTSTVAVYTSGQNLVLPAVRLAGTPVIVDPDGNTVSVAARDINLLSGIIRVPYARAGAWQVTVASGAATIPADVELAVLIIGKHLWDTQRVPGRGVEAVPAGFAIPNRAATLLEPYLLPVLA